MSKFSAGEGMKGGGRGAAQGAMIGAGIGAVGGGVGAVPGAMIGGAAGGALGFLSSAWSKDNFELPSVQLPGMRSIREEPRGQFEQMLRQEAMGSGLTSQRQFALGQQLDQIPMQAQRGMQSQISQLAQTGGVTGGARERLAKAAQEQSFQGRQQARQSAIGGSIADRMALQRSFATQEGQERQFDISNQLKRDELQSQLDASRNLAQAQIQASQGGGGLLGGLFG